MEKESTPKPLPEGVTMNPQFIDLLMEMREAQKKFFAGDRSVVARAKRLEKTVDDMIDKSLREAGYTWETWKRRSPPVEQGGLF